MHSLGQPSNLSSSNYKRILQTHLNDELQRKIYVKLFENYSTMMLDSLKYLMC